MRIERVEVDDDLAVLVDATWPDATWSEVIEYALALAVEYAQQADGDAAQDGAGQSEPPGSSGHGGDPVDDLEAKLAAALGRST